MNILKYISPKLNNYSSLKSISNLNYRYFNIIIPEFIFIKNNNIHKKYLLNHCNNYTTSSIKWNNTNHLNDLNYTHNNSEKNINIINQFNIKLQNANSNKDKIIIIQGKFYILIYKLQIKYLMNINISNNNNYYIVL